MLLIDKVRFKYVFLKKEKFLWVIWNTKVLDYLLQFLLFCAKIIVVLGGIIVLVGFVAKLKQHAIASDGTDPEKADLLITDYQEFLENDKLKLLKKACTPEQLKELRKALKAQQKAKAEAEKKRLKAGMKQELEKIKETVQAQEQHELSTDIKNEALKDIKLNANTIVSEHTNNQQEAVNESEKTTSQNSQEDGPLKKEQAAVGTDDEKSVAETNVVSDIGTLHTFFIIDFDGSVSGKEVQFLRRAVTLLVQVAEAGDEVFLRLKSPGGVVNGYGLCAAELERLRRAGLRLTVAVDEVAASGGYMMACVASKLIAAPFAYIGSIGVVAEFPNFNRVLKKYDVDYEQVTAGEFKRTMTTFGENTDEAREKFKEELKAVHEAFKNHVAKYRPGVDISKVGTGEHWLAIDAIKFGLIDELITSDEYILKNANKFDRVLKLEYKLPTRRGHNLLPFLSSKLIHLASNFVECITKAKY